MKVCTDSCIFGAWIANAVEKKKINPQNILDIGTGTGLLSLMLAQKCNATIHAIEIDKNACEQAIENCKLTCLPDRQAVMGTRIEIFHADIKNWKPSLQYELIICNPPFYENNLLPEDERKNIAKHSAALNLEELIVVTNNLLSNGGALAAILPWHRSKFFEETATMYSLFIKEKIKVKQTPSPNYFRVMYLLQKQKTEPSTKEITIKNGRNEYTQEFKGLLKDYYLYL